MKLSYVPSVVSSLSSVSGSKGQSNLERMKGFYSDAANAVLFPVGALLAIREAGRTLAEWLIDGEEIDLTVIRINGIEFPLQDGFKLTLGAGFERWACPACRSAHGSNIGVSAGGNGVNGATLKTNRFFYSPVSRALFVISATCWDKYVTGSGKDTLYERSRFVLPTAELAAQYLTPVLVTTPALTPADTSEDKAQIANLLSDADKSSAKGNGKRK